MAKMEIVDNEPPVLARMRVNGFPLQAGGNHCVISGSSQNPNHNGSEHLSSLFYVANTLPSASMC